jgi:hypothetical protein
MILSLGTCRLYAVWTGSTTSIGLSSGSLPGRISMTRRVLSRPSGMVSPERKRIRRCGTWAGSAGVPSSCSSLKMNVLRFSRPLSAGTERPQPAYRWSCERRMSAA